MDFSHLSLSERKKMFFILVGITSTIAIFVWIFMVRMHVQALSGVNTISQALGTASSAQEVEEAKTFTPSMSQIFRSYVVNIWDMAKGFSSLFESKEIEISDE